MLFKILSLIIIHINGNLSMNFSSILINFRPDNYQHSIKINYFHRCTPINKLTLKLTLQQEHWVSLQYHSIEPIPFYSHKLSISHSLSSYDFLFICSMNSFSYGQNITCEPSTKYILVIL